MTPELFLTAIIDPGLAFLADLGGPPPGDAERRFLLCVAMQEGGPELEARYQNSPAEDPGPARGRWQFEQGGGVTGVLWHDTTTSLAMSVCIALCVVINEAAVWRALEGHDTLACCFTRLLLLTDPYPVPTTEAAAWDCYCNRLWRPGKPHPETWPENWRIASETVAAHPVDLVA